MLLTNAANIWGSTRGLEAQRSDLWRINMSPAISYFNNFSDSLFVTAGLLKSNLPSAETAAFYATRISIPVQKTITTKYIQGTIPRNMPGYFEALDSAKIEFIHEATYENSPLYTLLQIWRLVSRIGRIGNNGEPALLLPTCTFKPQYKFNIRVELLNGNDGYHTDENNNIGFLEGAQYTLTACWPRGIQQSIVDSSQKAQIHTISVQFQPQEITA